FRQEGRPPGVNYRRRTREKKRKRFQANTLKDAFRNPVGADFSRCAPAKNRRLQFEARRFYNKFVALRLNRMTDRQLLDVRLCDLPVRISGTQLEQRIEKLYRELESRSLHFRP